MRALCARFDGRLLARPRARHLPDRVRAHADRARLARGAHSRASTAAAGSASRGRVGDPRGDQRLRRQRRRLPRPDVHDGHGAAARLGGAEATATCPAIARGELRLQAFAVTEPTAGSDTTSIQTTAERVGGRLRRARPEGVDVSRALHSDLMLLLARTTPLDEVEKRTEGLSVFLVDMREAGERPARSRRSATHDEPRHHRGLLRRRAPPGVGPGRRGRQRLPLHPRRLERRADPDRRRVRRRRPLVRREGVRLRVVSGWCSGARSAPTRACSSPSPGPTRRSRRRA